MAELRERPYSQFNFLVTLGNDDPSDFKAGFQEVSGLGMEITVAEYRAGNWPLNSSLKITGTYKVPDVTLKRGVVGAKDLNTWLDKVCKGDQDQLRNVTIQLLNEERDPTKVAQEWRLINARPTKFTGPSLNGKGTDVAIEELVLACEDIILETD